MTEKPSCSKSCTQEQCSTGDCSTCTSAPRLPPGILSRYDIDGSTADGILVWAEVDDNEKIEPSVYEILGEARRLKAGRIFAVLFGDAEKKLLYSDLFEYGVDTIYHIRNGDLNPFRPNDYTMAIIDVTERTNPAMIMISGTVKGNELAPLIAKSLGAEYLQDDKNIPITAVSPPKVLSFAPKTFKAPEREVGRKGTAMNRQFKTSIEK